MDRGPWRVFDDGKFVCSDDSAFGAQLRVGGDMTPKIRRQYAEWLANELNNGIKIRLRIAALEAMASMHGQEFKSYGEAYSRPAPTE